MIFLACMYTTSPRNVTHPLFISLFTSSILTNNMPVEEWAIWR
ncbi:MAG: hypothetical protein AAF824_04355 [Bacteroidota bacterium]